MDIFRFPLENETQKSKIKLLLLCHAGDPRETPLNQSDSRTQPLYKPNSNTQNFHNFTNSHLLSHQLIFKIKQEILQWLLQMQQQQQPRKEEEENQKPNPFQDQAKPVFNSPLVALLVSSKPVAILSVLDLVHQFISPLFLSISLRR
jgi:hypothetical protein